jgi:hypothetical protein
MARDEPPPTSAETWAVPPSSQSSEGIAARRPSIAVRVLRWIGVLLSIALAVLGATWKRSLDLPWTGTVRYGLYGNGLPTRWRCAEGHDHRSIPFWMAVLTVALITLVLFVRPWRRSSRMREPLP